MFQFLRHLFHHEQTSHKEKLISAVLMFGYVVGMGSRGQNAVTSSWYQALVRPDIQPPDWAFPLVWGFLFLLIGFAGYYAWNFYKSNVGRKLFAVLYAFNGFLMAAWTHTFFVQQNMANAVYIIVGLIIVIELMIITGFYTNRNSSYLLLPYLAWILFATYLNISYLTLNS